MSRCLKDTEAVFSIFPRQVDLLFPYFLDQIVVHTILHTKPSTGCLTTTLAIQQMQQMQLYVFIRTCSTYSLISFAGTLVLCICSLVFSSALRSQEKRKYNK